MDGFDIDDIDDVIHGRVRLGVMAYLLAPAQRSLGEHPTAASGYVWKNSIFQSDTRGLDH